MNAAKTPLVQKLILGVLSLILICLVVLIVQNSRQRSAQPPVEIATDTPETATPPGVEEPELKPVPLTTRRPEVRRPSPPAPVTKPQIQFAALPAKVETVANDSQFPSTHTALVSPSPYRSAEAAPGQSGEGTLVSGRVVLSGTPPPETRIALDATCGRAHADPLFTRHYVVGPDHGLANVLVYVKAGIAPMRDSNTLAPALNNVGCMFEPYVMGVLAGQKIRLLNSDPILHNVHATPKMSREVNLALPSEGHSAEVSFPNPELSIRVKCDVHPWMFAYVNALEHPFFAVTDTNGDFTFPAPLPPGRYLIAATHLKAGESVVEIEAGRTSTLILKLALRARPR